MNKFIAICVFAAFAQGVKAFSEEQKYQLQSAFLKFGQECAEDFPIQAEEAEEFMNSRFPSGENTGCFGACVFKKAGVFDEEGKLSPAKALENVKVVVQDEEQLKTISEIFDSCSNVNDEASDSQGCQRASAAFNCLQGHAAKYGYNL